VSGENIADELHSIDNEQNVRGAAYQVMLCGDAAINDSKSEYSKHDQIHTEEVDVPSYVGNQSVRGAYYQKISRYRRNYRRAQQRHRRRCRFARFNREIDANRKCEYKQQEYHSKLFSHKYRLTFIVRHTFDLSLYQFIIPQFPGRVKNKVQAGSTAKIVKNNAIFYAAKAY